jgi:hypothetical protein
MDDFTYYNLTVVGYHPHEAISMKMAERALLLTTVSLVVAGQNGTVLRTCMGCVLVVATYKKISFWVLV